MIRKHILGLFCLFLACGDADKNTEEEGVTNTSYYFADIVITIESNQMQLQDEYWVERIIDAESSTITENWTAVDGTASAYVYQADLDAQTFDIAIYMEGTLEVEGEGVFEGEGLNWTFSEHSYLNVDGVTEITRRNYEAEQIVSGTVGYGMAGGAEWTLDEVLTPITESEWSTGVESTAE